MLFSHHRYFHLTAAPFLLLARIDFSPEWPSFPQDSSFTDVSLGVQTDFPAVVRGLMLENVTFTRVATFASGFEGNAAGTTIIPLWIQVRVDFVSLLVRCIYIYIVELWSRYDFINCLYVSFLRK